MEWMILPLKKYAQFSGRSRRMEYWMFSLFVWIVYIVLGGGIFALVGSEMMALGRNPESTDAIARLTPKLLPYFSVIGIVWLGLLIPSIAVGVRRMHDTDRSGWWAVAPFILSLLGGALTLTGIGWAFSLASFVFSIIVFVFSVLEGTKGPNRFGPDPKDPSGDLESVFS